MTWRMRSCSACMSEASASRREMIIERDAAGERCERLRPRYGQRQQSALADSICIIGRIVHGRRRHAAGHGVVAQAIAYVRARNTLRVDDVEHAAGADDHIGRIPAGRDQPEHAKVPVARSEDGHGVGAAIGDVQRELVRRERERVRGGAAVALGHAQQALGGDRGNLFEERAAAGVDDRDRIGVVERGIQTGAVAVQDQLVRIAAHRDACAHRARRKIHDRSRGRVRSRRRPCGCPPPAPSPGTRRRPLRPRRLRPGEGRCRRARGRRLSSRC